MFLFCFVFSENFDSSSIVSPFVRAEETKLMLWSSMCELLFPVKCFLGNPAWKHCFSVVCTPKKHSGEQCFYNNVSLFVGP